VLFSGPNRKQANGQWQNILVEPDRLVLLGGGIAPNSLNLTGWGLAEQAILSPTRRRKEMDIPLDAEVFCTDGFCGRSTRVVLKPKCEEVTHLVVKEETSPHKEILIPVTAVTATTPDSINLSYTRGKLAKLQLFIETEYVEVDIPRFAGGAYSLEPYGYPEHETLAVKHEAVPEGELALHRGVRVEATDGQVGRVDELLMDPENDHITHIKLQEGHLWGQKEVTIPISQIQRMSEDTVYLKLDKRGVAALPATSVRRKRL
jgi:uncharacterized protein YrrD